MRSLLINEYEPRRLKSFDQIVDRFSETSTSFSESDALKASHWEMGEDARLREDVRFRQTPWGRWILSRDFLANDALYDCFLKELRSEIDLLDRLSEFFRLVGRKCVFCPADERFVLSNDKLRLSAKELTGRPLIEETVTDIEKFTTHLPVHSLRAAAASEPAGEWGPNTQEQHIETLGWVRVSVPGRRKLNERMFVAQIEGHSMDDGRNGLVDGGYAIFELWPEGTRQNLSVLVRASFSDPETGSYAVKKYIADARNEHGEHREIRLVSLNPDKERFPDIIVDPEDDVTVVAKVVQALSPSDFAQEPKMPRRPGRRNLSEPSELAARELKLRHTANSFFTGEPDDSDAAVLSSEWKSRLVCLDAEAGGLAIETQALSWLPPFAKLLSIKTGSAAPIVVLASNLRNKTWRTSVPPSSSPYQWSANSELVDETLAEYEVPGLEPGRCKLFRVNALGIGEEISGNTLSPGGNYRILVPPERTLDATACDITITGDGWKLWDIVVPAAPSERLRNLLRDLGYQCGEAAPTARLVLRAPVAYEYTPKGEPYAVFHLTTNPIVSITGIRCEHDKDLLVILASDIKTESAFLLPGSNWTVELGSLEPGRYILQIVHERTSFAPVMLPFAITSSKPAIFPAALTVSYAGEAIAQTADGIYVAEGNLANEFETSLQIQSPPCWSFNLGWDDGAFHRLGAINASPDGQLDLTQLSQELAQRIPDVLLSSLLLDAGELGLIEFQHSRRLSFSQLKVKMRTLFNTYGEGARKLDEQFQLLQKLWIKPILNLLGFGLKEATEAELHQAPVNIVPIRLISTRRINQGRIRKYSDKALLITSPSADLNSVDRTSARLFADQLCDKWDVSEVILTDGFRWAKQQAGARWQLKVFDLAEVLSNDELNFFIDFIQTFAHPSAAQD
jgi:hypothetical protein